MWTVQLHPPNPHSRGSVPTTQPPASYGWLERCLEERALPLYPARQAAAFLAHLADAVDDALQADPRCASPTPYARQQTVEAAVERLLSRQDFFSTTIASCAFFFVVTLLICFGKHFALFAYLPPDLHFFRYFVCSFQSFTGKVMFLAQRI